jgi:hypothetical protein
MYAVIKAIGHHLPLLVIQVLRELVGIILTVEIICIQDPLTSEEVEKINGILGINPLKTQTSTPNHGFHLPCPGKQASGPIPEGLQPGYSPTGRTAHRMRTGRI